MYECMHPVECLLTPLVFFSLGAAHAGLRDVRAARRQGVQLRGGRRARRLRTAHRVLLRTGRRVHVSTRERLRDSPRARVSTQPLPSRMLVSKVQRRSEIGGRRKSVGQTINASCSSLLLLELTMDKRAYGDTLLRGYFFARNKSVE